VKSIFQLLLLIAICLSIGAIQAIEAQTIYDVKGKIYGPDSKPVPNVLVTLENHAHALIGQDTTNTDGRYEFNGIVAGTYYISVKPDETRYQAVFQKIDLINTSVGANSYSTETIDFSVKYTPRREQTVGTVYVQTIPPEAEKEYLAAVKNLEKGDKEQAAKRLRKAIDVFPTYFYALQQLGVLLVEQENMKMQSSR
jgi:protocatechuate 3,4-dioxygenase beta subunit